MIEGFGFTFYYDLEIIFHHYANDVENPSENLADFCHCRLGAFGLAYQQMVL